MYEGNREQLATPDQAETVLREIDRILDFMSYAHNLKTIEAENITLGRFERPIIFPGDEDYLLYGFVKVDSESVATVFSVEGNISSGEFVLKKRTVNPLASEFDKIEGEPSEDIEESSQDWEKAAAAHLFERQIGFDLASQENAENLINFLKVAHVEQI